jgi:hypothetical protein
MRTQEKFYPSIIGVAVATGLILLVPLVAMQFTEEVKWDMVDFIIIGALVFSTGLSYKLVTRNAYNLVHRVAIGLGLGATLFMIWANLGVGLIGSGPNPGNLMYIGILAVIIIGTIRSHFKPEGMEWAMYLTVLALIIHTLIALLAGMHHYPDSSVNEILSVNGFFAVLFFVSGILFHQVAKDTAYQMNEKSNG